MKKTFFKIILIIFLVSAVLFSLGLTPNLAGDGWICKNNQWLKKGAPLSSQPECGCRDFPSPH